MSEGFPLDGFTAEDVPMLLLPYQQEWVDAILAGKDPFALYTKSRRIGVSWADAAGAALLGSQVKGRNTFYIGYEKEMTRGYINDCADWAKLYALGASEVEESEEIWREGEEDKAIQVFRIFFNSGFRIEALSSKPRNLRSRQGDVVLDEAAFHDDLPGMMKAARALRIWGGRIRLITTYNGVANPYYELEEQVLAGKLPYQRYFTTFLHAIEQGLFKRICLITGQEWSEPAEQDFIRSTLAEFGEDADEELLCIPAKGGGKYFSRVLVESTMQPLPIARLELPDSYLQLTPAAQKLKLDSWIEQDLKPALSVLEPDLKTFLGGDFGRVGDLSVFMVGQEMRDLTRRGALAIELRNVPYLEQFKILSYCIKHSPRFISAALDAAGNGLALAESGQREFGSRVQAIKPNDSFYLEHFPKLRAAMQDGKFVQPASSDLLDDFGLVELMNGTPKIPSDRRTKGKDGKQRHGDGCIAALMFWVASTQPYVPIEFEAIEGGQDAHPTGFGFETAQTVRTEQGFGVVASGTDLRGF